MSIETDNLLLSVGQVKHFVRAFREGMVTEAERVYGVTGAMQVAAELDRGIGGFGAYLDAQAETTLRYAKENAQR